MRNIDMKDMFIVHRGEEWVFEKPPSSKEMIKQLERNERIVSWIQPQRGTVDDQIPVWHFQVLLEL